MKVIARLGLLCCFCALGQAASAEDGAFERAAQTVIDALAAGDDERVKAVAAAAHPDPWNVANELCARERHADAAALARVYPRPDRDQLLAFVRSRTGYAFDTAIRMASLKADAAFRTGSYTEVIAAIEGMNPPDLFTACDLDFTRGHAFQNLGKAREAWLAFQASAAKALQLGWAQRSSHALGGAASNAHTAKEYRTALKLLQRRLTVDEARGERAEVADAHNGIGANFLMLQDFARSIESYERARNLARELGDEVRLLQILVNIAQPLNMIGRVKEGLAAMDEALPLAKRSPNRALLAQVHLRRGLALRSRGRFEEAAGSQEASLRIWQALGNQGGIAASLNNLSDVRVKQARYEDALTHQKHALKIAREMRNAYMVANVQLSMGTSYSGLGRYPEALRAYEDSLTIIRSLGRERAAAIALNNMANVHQATGDYAKALVQLDRALESHKRVGNRGGIAHVLLTKATVYQRLDSDRALPFAQKSLALFEQLGMKREVAITLGIVGNCLRTAERFDEALASFERSRKLAEDLGDDSAVGLALGNIAQTHFRNTDHAQAIFVGEQALEMLAKSGAKRADVARARGNLALALALSGDTLKARAYAGEAIAEARRLEDPNVLFESLWILALADAQDGDFAAALEAAKQAAAEIPKLVKHLAEEEAAGARSRFRDLLDLGAKAALQVGDAPTFAWFLEIGRARTLLEALGGRREMQAHLLGDELRGAFDQAQVRARVALDGYQKAAQGGKLAEVRAKRSELDAAQRAVQAVVERMEREAKAAARILHPPAITLAEMRGLVGPTEALVIYAVLSRTFSEEVIALVVTPEATRVHELGPVARIEAAWAAIDLDGAAEGEVLAGLLVEPLGIDKKIRRVLISPDGMLGYLPFSLLFGGREIAHLPSATTWSHLRGAPVAKGEKVLALGNPIYARSGPGALMALPATEEEAKAVGDVVLLGKEASETRLRETLKTQTRWRAVHLACHGLVDPENPRQSSLALTATEDDDGFLTALEVFQMPIPADLVVLSACETGKGRIYGGEGIVGLMRAFMFAGAPRVLVSLWKVDDRSTRVLMERFYALWRKQGLTPAAALAGAQTYLREFEESVPDAEASREAGRTVHVTRRPFRAPRHWAGWALWGLAN